MKFQGFNGFTDLIRACIHVFLVYFLGESRLRFNLFRRHWYYGLIVIWLCPIWLAALGCLWRRMISRASSGAMFIDL